MVAESLLTRLRRLVRRSMVLQILRLRVVSATERLSPSLAPPEPPLQSYAAQPAPRISAGLAIARASIEDIARTASAAGASTAVVLMPARFQVDDGDFGRLKEIVSAAGRCWRNDNMSSRRHARIRRSFGDWRRPRIRCFFRIGSRHPSHSCGSFGPRAHGC
jgi:hypothetical protein